MAVWIEGKHRPLDDALRCPTCLESFPVAEVASSDAGQPYFRPPEGNDQPREDPLCPLCPHPTRLPPQMLRSDTVDVLITLIGPTHVGKTRFLRWLKWMLVDQQALLDSHGFRAGLWTPQRAAWMNASPAEDLEAQEPTSMAITWVFPLERPGERRKILLMVRDTRGEDASAPRRASTYATGMIIVAGKDVVCPPVDAPDPLDEEARSALEAQLPRWTDDERGGVRDHLGRTVVLLLTQADLYDDDVIADAVRNLAPRDLGSPDLGRHVAEDSRQLAGALQRRGSAIFGAVVEELHGDDAARLYVSGVGGLAAITGSS
ncbi:MAG TPA: hypothetical protein VM575_04135, partial [Nocardioides sp.]|nr:hypothetical protein [Nocardioides sp.]